MGYHFWPLEITGTHGRTEGRKGADAGDSRNFVDPQQNRIAIDRSILRVV